MVILLQKKISAKEDKSLVPEDVAKTKNGELNYGATVEIKSDAGTGSGIVIGENLVLSVSHNFNQGCSGWQQS